MLVDLFRFPVWNTSILFLTSSCCFEHASCVPLRGIDLFGFGLVYKEKPERATFPVFSSWKTTKRTTGCLNLPPGGLQVLDFVFGPHVDISAGYADQIRSYSVVRAHVQVPSVLPECFRIRGSEKTR